MVFCTFHTEYISLKLARIGSSSFDTYHRPMHAVSDTGPNTYGVNEIYSCNDYFVASSHHGLSYGMGL